MNSRYQTLQRLLLLISTGTQLPPTTNTSKSKTWGEALSDAPPPALPFLIPDRISSVASLLKKAFEDSSSLLTKRPGHESLWYLRRALTSLCLNQIESLYCLVSPHDKHNATALSTETYHMLRSLMLETIHSACADVDSCPDDGLHEFEMRDPTVIWSMFHQIFLSKEDSARLGRGDWLYEWVSTELEFVRLCARDQGVWGFRSQRRFALRYGMFLLHSITIYVTRRDAHLMGHELDDGGGASSELGALRIRISEDLREGMLLFADTLAREGKSDAYYSQNIFFFDVHCNCRKKSRRPPPPGHVCPTLTDIFREINVNENVCPSN